jgi:hypothetical protein
LEIDIEREKVSLTMKDGSDAWSQKVKHAILEERKRDIGWSIGGKDDDNIPETTMRGNISFS